MSAAHKQLLGVIEDAARRARRPNISAPALQHAVMMAGFKFLIEKIDRLESQQKVRALDASGDGRER